MRPVFIDIETASGVDLRKVGGRRYATHPSTRVLCLCASWDDVQGNEISLAWVPSAIGLKLPSHTEAGVAIHRGDTPPKELLDAIDRIGVVSAHNANSFDRHIWNYHVKHPIGRWVDTIHLARANGLPAALDKLGNWFVGEGKDDGSAVMKKLMVLTWDEKNREWFNKHTLPGAVASVVKYCSRDVDLLRIVYDRVVKFDPNDASGLDIDLIVNDLGVAFDEHLAAKIASVSTSVVTAAGKEIVAITSEMGKPLTVEALKSIPKMHAWLQSVGVRLDNLRRKTIDKFINDPEEFILERDDTEETESLNVTPQIMRVLRLRNSFLRVTGAKLERASASALNGRLYDLFVYYGAHTGRWSSRIVQVHNLPRGNDKLNLPLLCRDCSVENVWKEADRLGILPDDVLSALVRPTLIPSAGYEFVIGDFASIEARVLGWMARETKLVEAFVMGQDTYKSMASLIYGVEYDAVTKDQRAVGKIGILGCGYGMGGEKLADFAAAMNIDLESIGITSYEIVDKYRSAYPAIAGTYDGEYEGRPVRRGGLWRDMENAFRDTTTGDRTFVDVGRCRVTRESNNAVLTLPSGRRITYPKMRLEPYVDRYGRERIGLVYTSGRGDVHTYGGKLVENAVQGVARDIMRDAMLRAIDTMSVVLHVHDEIVAETPKGTGKRTLRDLLGIMSTSPEWATGLPLDADGHVAPRYTKTEWDE